MIRAEISKIENRKAIMKIYKIESWFFEKVNKTDKLLVGLTKEKKRLKL